MSNRFASFSFANILTHCHPLLRDWKKHINVLTQHTKLDMPVGLTIWWYCHNFRCCYPERSMASLRNSQMYPMHESALEPAVESISSKRKTKTITNTCALESLLFPFYNFLIWHLNPGGHRRRKGEIRKGWKTTPCPFPPLQGSGPGRPELRDWGKLWIRCNIDILTGLDF